MLLAPVLLITFIREIQLIDICFTIKPTEAALDPTIRCQQTNLKKFQQIRRINTHYVPSTTSQVSQWFWQSLHMLFLPLCTMVFILSINLNKIHFRYHSIIFRISSHFKNQEMQWCAGWKASSPSVCRYCFIYYKHKN